MKLKNVLELDTCLAHGHAESRQCHRHDRTRCPVPFAFLSVTSSFPSVILRVNQPLSVSGLNVA